MGKKITKYTLSNRESEIFQIDGGEMVDRGPVDFSGNGNFTAGSFIETSTVAQTNAIGTITVSSSAANKDLINADSGKVVLLNGASSSANPALSSCHTLTLPAVADTDAGWHIRVIVGDIASNQTASIVTNGGEDKIAGQLLLITGSNAAAGNFTCISDANADAIQLQGAMSASGLEPGIQAGSFIDIVSNGSLFYINGRLNGTSSAMSTT